MLAVGSAPDSAIGVVCASRAASQVIARRGAWRTEQPDGMFGSATDPAFEEGPRRICSAVLTRTPAGDVPRGAIGATLMPDLN
jgi:hypothetical protein